LSRAIFYRRLAFPELQSAAFEASGVKLTIWFVRLIAAIIFIALGGDATERIGDRSEQQSLFQRHFGRRPFLQPRAGNATAAI